MMDPWISEEHQNTSNSAESLDSPSSQRKLPTNVSLAKRRLQAYSNSKLLMKDAKKAEEKAPAKDEKKSKKALYPDDRARAVISEIEEIKKKEAEEEEKKALHGKEMLAVAIKTIATINRPRSRSLSAERDNHFKRRDIKSRNYRKIASKGRRRSLSSDSRPKKKYDQSDYPKTWQEYAEQALVTSKDIELKKKLFQGTSNKRDAFTKLYRFDTTWPSPQENFRPQENGLKEVPLAFIRVTKSKPAITFNVNFRKNKESFLSRSQLFQIVPKERKQIIEKLMQSSGCKTFTSKPPMTTRKWYQKSWKKMPEAECKVIENSVGLSFLQNYSDEEEETEEIAPLVSTEPITQEEEMECQKKEDDKTEDYKKEEPKETTKEEYTPERKSDSSKSRIARTKEAIKAIEEAIEKKKEKIKKEVAVTKLKKENKTKTKKKETSDSDSSNSEEETIKTKKYKRKKRQEKTSEDEEKSKKKNKKKVRLKTKSKRKLKKIIKESSDESEIEITKKKNKRTRILKKKSLKSDEHSSSEEIETTKNKKKRPKQMIEIATPETPQKEELQSQNYEDEFPLVKDTVISDENWEQDWEETELVPPPPKPKLNTSWESDEEIFERRNYNSERKIMECFDLEMPLNIPLKKRRLQDKPEEVSELEKVELNLWDKDKVSTPQIPEKDTSIYLETEYEEFMRALNSGEKSKPKPINCVIDLNEVESNIKFKPMEIPLPKEEPTNDIKPVPVPSPKVDVDKLPKSLINLSLSANITLDIASKVNSFQPVKVVESEEYKPSQPDEKLETIAPFSFSGMVLPTKKLLLDNSNLKLGDSDEDSKPEEDLADKLQETKKQTVNDLENNGSTLKIKLEPQEDPLKSKHDLSPKITELSPKRTGESPGKRVDSPKKVIKSPRKKEESPKRREESPKKREESPKKREESPKKREGSPRKREESPWKREESPRKREESPRRKKCSSPRRRRSKSPRRRRSPPRRDYSPRRKSPPSARKRSPAKRKYSSSYRPLSPGYRKRSQSPRRRSQSPRRRSQSPPRRKSQSPQRRRSQSPLRRRSQSPKQKRRSKSPDRRPSTGRHHRLSPKRKSSPIAPPLERLKRSIADSTISDDLLPQPGEYVQPPHYYKPAEVEGLKPIETTYSNDYSYHNQYEMMGGFDHIGEEIKTEDMSLSNNTFVSNNFVQVGNMVQIVPVDIPIKNELVETPKIHRELTHIQVDNYYHHIPVSGPPPPPPPQEQTEKLLAEESMKKKMAERKAERERRRAEKERKRKEKEKRRREKEKQRQVRLKLKTENMIKRALQLEVAALAEDEEISTFNETPPQWPPLHYVQGVSKDLARSILRRAGQKKDKISPDKKCVQFADGVKPGEGTSPSGGEDLGSPPRRVMLPKEKRYTKTKLKKKIAKKKVKVKVIKKPDTPEQYEDDDEIDENLPPPSPPPGSPPPHIFPPRVKNNNIHQSLIGVVPGYGPTQLNLIMAPPPPPPPHHYPPPPHHHGPPHHGPPHHGPPPPPHHGPPHPHHGPPPPPPHHHHHPPPPGPPHHPPYHHY